MADFKLEPKQIEQQKLIAENQFVLAEGGSRCFVPSQEVITSNGPVMISDIKPGDRVFTMNESNNEREFKTVQQVHRFTGNKKRMITVKLKTGETITATEDHEIRFNGGWHMLKDVLEWVHGNLESNPRV